MAGSAQVGAIAYPKGSIQVPVAHVGDPGWGPSSGFQAQPLQAFKELTREWTLALSLPLSLSNFYKNFESSYVARQFKIHFKNNRCSHEMFGDYILKHFSINHKGS